MRCTSGWRRKGIASASPVRVEEREPGRELGEAGADRAGMVGRHGAQGLERGRGVRPCRRRQGGA